MKGFIIFILVAVALMLGLVGFVSSVPGKSARGALPTLGPDELTLKKKLEEHVTVFARDIGKRNPTDGPRMGRALEYIEEQLARTNYEMTKENVEAGGRTGVILIAQQRGTSAPTEIVLLGSHYDSPRASPGGDCNGSGSAAAIELARQFAGKPHERTLRFVFFSLSEAPFAGTVNQGAAQYGRRCAEKKENIVGALVLEGLGAWSGETGTQSVPFPLNFAYPDTADFLAFVGGFGSRDMLAQVVTAFRAGSRLPSEGATLPGIFPGYSGSNAAALASAGFPAVLVTDTGLMRHPDYGTESDTHDRIDYERMTLATQGLVPVLDALLRRTAKL